MLIFHQLSCLSRIGSATHRLLLFSHNCLHIHIFPDCRERDFISFDRDIVDHHGNGSFFYVIRIFHRDMVPYTAEFSAHFKTIHFFRDAGIHDQPVVVRTYPQDILGNVQKRPGCSAAELVRWHSQHAVGFLLF